MSSRCGEFERFEAARRDPGLWAAWVRHVRTCPSCQQQDAADRKLRGLFAGTRAPVLPPLFAQRCAERARQAGLLKPGARARHRPG